MCVCIVVVDVVVVFVCLHIVSACLIVVFNSQQHSVEVNICHELKPRKETSKKQTKRTKNKEREREIKIDFLPFRVQK